MFNYKVDLCLRNRSHDCTSYPYADKGKKVWGRDPVLYNYAPFPCPKGDNCEKGNACGLAHARFDVLAPPAKVVDAPLQGARSTRKVSSGAKQCTSGTGSTSPNLGSGWTQPVWSLCQPEGGPVKSLRSSFRHQQWRHALEWRRSQRPRPKKGDTGDVGSSLGKLLRRQNYYSYPWNLHLCYLPPLDMW